MPDFCGKVILFQRLRDLDISFKILKIFDFRQDGQNEKNERGLAYFRDPFSSYLRKMTFRVEE